MSLAGALELIGRGIPVFPCDPATKAPIVQGGRGFHDATCDVGQVEAWWREFPGALVGVPTGRRSGLAVFDVDVDREHGIDGVASLQSGAIRPPKTRAHLTPRGGMHLIYSVGDGDVCPSDAGQLGAGLDRRGEGGYVVWYPASGGTVIEDCPIAPAPDWLLRPGDGRARGGVRRVVDALRARGMIEGWLGDVVGAPHGEHNVTLARSAFLCGQMVEAGFVDAESMAASLVAACAGWPEDSKTKPRAALVVAKAFKRAAGDPGFESVEAHLLRVFAAPVKWLRSFLLHDFSEWVGQPRPVRYLIDDTLIHGICMIFGEPGAGKSFIALDWALSVACGRQWFGRDVMSGPVVYVAGEGHEGMPARLKAWSLDRGVSPGMGRFVLSDRAVAFNRAEDLQGLIAEIKALEIIPVLVVVDTLQTAIPGGDDKNSVDAGLFNEACKEIQRTFGCCVLVVHHSGHGDKTRAKGAIDFKGAVDTECGALAAGTKNSHVKLVNTKMKDGPKFEDMVFAFKEVPLPWFNEKKKEYYKGVVLDTSEEVPEVSQGGGWRGPSENDRLFCACLGLEPKEYDALKDAFLAAHKAGDRKVRVTAFNRTYDRAVDRGWLTRTDDTVDAVPLALKRDGII